MILFYEPLNPAIRPTPRKHAATPSPDDRLDPHFSSSPSHWVRSSSGTGIAR
ncbi:hypothetical protein [Novosphingobium sp. PhB55]|uniref:hypothetical protein n=1 Tax=Novosphingobium sp. PhB55 TaxID=2485106 RepID=UPI001416F18A|nr:hypothetical protein [Novosphingobium sp. PhB55]